MRSWLWVATSLTSALAVALAGGCSRGDSAVQGSPEDRNGGERSIPVAVVQAETRDLARTVTVTAPVEPLRTVSVSAQTAGVVLRVLVEEGDRLHSGQLLAELDARETSAQLQRARAILANAEAAYQRAERLQANGLTTEAELDATRSAYEIAAADVELWQTRLAFSRIVAPVSGIVTAKRIERGSAVTGNQPLFEIADDSLLVVRVRVSELDVVHLEAGNPVTVRLDAYPDAEIAGRVRRIFPSADASSRLVPVEVALGRTPPDVEARPGFLARVDFALQGKREALAVPAAAVGVGDVGAYVFVVDADTLVRKAVQTGLTAGGWVEITGGLRAGEPVVTSGHVNLRSGTRVQAQGGAVTEGET